MRQSYHCHLWAFWIFICIILGLVCRRRRRRRFCLWTVYGTYISINGIRMAGDPWKQQTGQMRVVCTSTSCIANKYRTSTVLACRVPVAERCACATGDASPLSPLHRDTTALSQAAAAASPNSYPSHNSLLPTLPVCPHNVVNGSLCGFWCGGCAGGLAAGWAWHGMAGLGVCDGCDAMCACSGFLWRTSPVGVPIMHQRGL